MRISQNHCQYPVGFVNRRTQRKTMNPIPVRTNPTQDGKRCVKTDQQEKESSWQDYDGTETSRHSRTPRPPVNPQDHRQHDGSGPRRQSRSVPIRRREQAVSMSPTRHPESRAGSAEPYSSRRRRSIMGRSLVNPITTTGIFRALDARPCSWWSLPSEIVPHSKHQRRCLLA